VKYFAWDDANNAKLRRERGIELKDAGRLSQAGRPPWSTSVKRATMRLDADEKELFEGVVRGEWKSAAAGKPLGPATLVPKAGSARSGS